MIVEIMASSILKPFYSASLQVWTIILGITLAGLTIGYFIGGTISKKGNLSVKLNVVLGIVILSLASIPKLSVWLLPALIDINYVTALTISASIILLPSLISLGSITPILIQLLTTEIVGSGKNAGKVYATSTLAGICSTFALGFFIIPDHGIIQPLTYSTIFLALIWSGLIFQSKKYKQLLLLLPCLLFLIPSGKQESQSPLKVIYNSNGILGQIKVYDHPSVENNKKIYRRLLLFNNVAHTGIDLETGFSLFDYTHLLSTEVAKYTLGREALVIGMAGGTIVDELYKLGFNIDAVEIDERMNKIATKYFYPKLKVNFIVDDGRHYLQTLQKKYGLIVFDAFIGETPPAHLITKESIKKLRNNLSDNGIVLFNTNNFITDEVGLANRSIVKTLLSENYNVKLVQPNQSDAGNNIIIVATKNKLNINNTAGFDYNNCCLKVNILNRMYEINLDTVKLDDAYILSDNSPIFEELYKPVAHETRQGSIDFFQRMFINEGIPLVE